MAEEKDKSNTSPEVKEDTPKDESNKDNSKKEDTYTQISAQFNEKKNVIKYSGHVYVNKSWKTWCWVLLILFIIIPAATGIISIITAGAAVGAAANKVGNALEAKANK